MDFSDPPPVHHWLTSWWPALQRNLCWSTHRKTSIGGTHTWDLECGTVCAPIVWDIAARLTVWSTCLLGRILKRFADQNGPWLSKLPAPPTAHPWNQNEAQEKAELTATVQQNTGVCSFSWNFANFSECRILWSMCSVVVHAFTLKLSIQTSRSVAPKLPVFARSCENFSKTSTPRESTRQWM